MAEKRRNEHTAQLKKIKLFMIFGYALIIIVTAIMISFFTVTKNDEVLKVKTSELTYALNIQMKLNINTFLSKLEDTATLVFGSTEAAEYDATKEADDKYDALATEKTISDKLNELCLTENYVDFFIVYANDHPVGKMSNGTRNLYGDKTYEVLSETITRPRTNDGWSTGYNGDFRRIYYVKRIHENALLVASFYTNELASVFVRSEDMRDTTVRLVSKDYRIIYSSADEELGAMLSDDIMGHIAGLSAATLMNDDYLVTVNGCGDNWYVICSVPTKIVLAERREVIVSTVIIAVLSAVLAIILGTILSIYVTNPVNHIVNKLDDRAKIDRLTGIYNKLSFEENAEYMLSSARTGEHHAIILMDIDNFKGVNDNLGHSYGDKVLADIGNILRLTFGHSDCLGRIGGDEFCVMLNIPENAQPDYMELVNDKCRSLCEAFHSNYTGDDGSYKISASIGVALFPEDGKEFNELYRNADKALYASKHKGKDTYTIFRDISEEAQINE